MEKLSEILSYAEGLDMPEGDYLKVANALKEVFNKKEKEVTNKVIEKPEDIVIKIYSDLNGLTYNINATKRKRVIRREERYVGAYAADCLVYTMDGKEKEIYYNYSMTFENSCCFLSTLLERLEATMVTIVKDGVTYEYEREDTCRRCIDYAKKSKKIIEECAADEEDDYEHDDTYDRFGVIHSTYCLNDAFYNYIEKRVNTLLDYIRED
jgi:hypothetical protein